MTSQIALLRGVNVGSKGARVAMADLRKFALDLGFTSARTLLQSGNLVVEGGVAVGEALEDLLAKEAKHRLGLTTEFLVRTPGELRDAIGHNPFADTARDDPSHLVVFFLKSEPGAGALESLRAAIKGRETVQLNERQAYFTYPDGIGDSRLTINVIEKALGVRGTGRNWNTVVKLAGMAGA